ncbi:hypothetical protein ACFQS1_12550 [Paractinoplanes rhizophilus]|jgi:hypothetical protein|uniref:Uncharacterized protein n=1 Tax=Paractinoplanes rhizophilus TaxID=1416877 RepID=A0ABW2HR12_9ACTN|nr:hypothetical protein [Actinoplanes sp.]
MDIDVAQTANAVLPYVTGAITAYGAATLDKVRQAVVDEAADGTVSLGHRILNRILRRDASRPAIEGAIGDVAAGEDGSDVALKLQIRKALAADPELAREVAAMLTAGGVTITASGERSVATQTNYGIISTGDNSTFRR